MLVLWATQGLAVAPLQLISEEVWPSPFEASKYLLWPW